MDGLSRPELTKKRISRGLSVAILVVVATPTFSARTYAQKIGAPNTTQPGVAPGGDGFSDPADAAPLTAQQQSILGAKNAGRAAWEAAYSGQIPGSAQTGPVVASSAQRPSGAGGVTPGYQSGNWYYANNWKESPEPDPSDNYGSGYGGGWIFNATKTNRTPSGHNPRYDTGNGGFYWDLCGPGSTTFITHTWQPSAVDSYSNNVGDGEGLSSNGVYGWGSGWYGFLCEAAYWEMQWVGKNNQNWGTAWQSEQSFLNNNQSQNYFASETAPSNSDFKYDIDWDLQTNGGASFTAVDTVNLPNWGGTEADHFISVNGWDPTDQQVKYADTAYQNEGATYGEWPSTGGMSESTFYNNALMWGSSHNGVSEETVLW